MRKLVILYFTVSILFNIGFAQNLGGSETLVKLCLDLPELQEHIKNNEILFDENKIVVRSNGLLPENLNIYKGDNKVDFIHTQSWEKFYNYEFTKFKVKNNKAEIVFKYFPTWYTETDFVRQTHWSYLTFELKFKKNELGWQIYDFSVSDVKFSEKSKTDRWLKERYKKFGEYYQTPKN